MTLMTRRARPARRRPAGQRRGAGAGRSLADQAGDADRALCRRRPHRHRGPHAGRDACRCSGSSRWSSTTNPAAARWWARSSSPRAPADGYTLGMAISAHMINPALQPKMAYDTVKDLAGVGADRAGALRPLRPPVAAGQQPGRAGGLRAPEPGQAELRHARHRHRHAPGGRDAGAHGRHLHGAHPLPRQRAGAAGRDRRPRAAALRRAVLGHALRARQPAQAAGAGQPEARRAEPRGAADGRDAARLQRDEPDRRHRPVRRAAAAGASASAPTSAPRCAARRWARAWRSWAWSRWAPRRRPTTRIIRSEIAKWTQVVKTAGIKLE